MLYLGLDKKLCAKTIPTTDSHTPGLFTKLCAHGIFYGIWLMGTKEGSHTPFEIFRDRFEHGE